MIRMCMNPFSVKLHQQISELENKLCEAEDAFDDLYLEKTTLSEEKEVLQKRLAQAHTQIYELECRYTACREAAQKFLDTKVSS